MAEKASQASKAADTTRDGPKPTSMNLVRSPYEKLVYSIREKLVKGGCVAPANVPIVGPSAFIESVLEIRDELVRAIGGGEAPNTSLVRCLQAGDLDLGHLLQVKSPYASTPFRVVQELYLRAFQSTKSRKYLRHFVMAISDGRFSEQPVDLSRISSDWCNSTHALYAKCWEGLNSGANGAVGRHGGIDFKSKSSKSEIAIGRTIAKKLLTSSKIKDRTMSRVCQQILLDDSCMMFIGRVLRFSKDRGTDELMKTVTSSVRSIAAENKCDMPKIIRAAMTTANAHGVDVSGGGSKIASLLKNMSSR